MAIVMAVGINRRRGDDNAQAATTVSEETTINPSARHYEGLDRVRIKGDNPSQEKDYEGFRLSFNKDTKTPNWVAWELTNREAQASEQSRSNNFWQDPNLYGCPDTDDYKRSGYDRGHMCPAADQKWSAQAMNDCFVMANMCPQDHNLNGRAWKTLETKEREWAQRDSALVIVAGPIYYKNDTKTIGRAGVHVPGAFFKILAAPYADKPRGIAFIYPNTTAPGNMEQYVVTIDKVEELTGFDFLYALPDDVEEAVESTASFREWNRR